MWKSEDHNLSDDRGQEGGESRITYHWNVDSSLFLAVVSKMTDSDFYEMYNSQQNCLDNQVKNALSFLTTLCSNQ